MKKHSSKKNGKWNRPSSSRSNCPITASPAAREAANQAADAVRGQFPKGIGAPALRALASHGLTHLGSLTTITESELAAMHGVGPKAIRILRAALLEQSLDFRSS